MHFTVPCRRGIPAEPILDGFCGDYEEGMDKDGGIHNTHSATNPCQSRASSNAYKPLSYFNFVVLSILTSVVNFQSIIYSNNVA